MQKTAEVLIIGGGVAGCSVAYHLGKRGCKDVVLLERSELTSGSTWHAAGNTHVLQDNANLSKLHYYTIKLYPQLEEETGQSCGIHPVGGIYLATTPERHDQIRIQASKAKYLGLEFETISLETVHEMNPLLNLDGVISAMFERNEAHIDPSGVANAYAAGARMHGVRIHRNAPVTATTQQPGGGWLVETPQGKITTRHLVNCAGLWGREVGRLAGLNLPLMPMEHQYLVTENIPEIEALDREIPLLHDNDSEYYMRQEGKGLLVGAYEKGGIHWAVDGTPLDFGHDLLPNDLDRMLDNVARAMHRMPCLETAGIKRIVNGPMIWTPDLLPLFGAVPQLSNYYLIGGLIPGFSMGGGLGLMMAEWILDGQPSLDLWSIDVARFGDWVTPDYVLETTADNYESRFRIFFPYEERTAGRPLRTRPAYAYQKTNGAMFGAQYGWEVPMWFAPDGMEPVETFSFRRTESFAPVGEECRTVRSAAGLLDTSAYAKFIVKGARAAEWLDQLTTNTLPQYRRMSLAPMVHGAGGVVADFTIARLEADEFLLIGAGVAENSHLRWFRKNGLASGVDVVSMSADWVGLSVSGPNSRALMTALTGEDFANEAQRFLSVRQVRVGPALAWVLRVAFTGELGYELYFPAAHQLEVLQMVMDEGQPYGIRQIGSRALLSLRLEKNYGSWGREYSPEYTPLESRLDRFVKFDKGEFIGRETLLKSAARTPRWLLTSFTVDVDEQDAVGGEPILCDGEVSGIVTSASFGHTTGRSIALGYIPPAKQDSRDIKIEIIGEAKEARIITEPLVDPSGLKMRG